MLARRARPLGSWHADFLRTFQTINYLSLLYYSLSGTRLIFWVMGHVLLPNILPILLILLILPPAPCYSQVLLPNFTVE